MTDKTGPDLALAVAHVMGKDACLKDGECWLVEDHYVRPRLTTVWRPDLGGAAGAEALDWAMFHIPGLSIESDCVIVDIRWWDSEPVEADDIWIALCRTIEAWGESR